MSCIFCFEPQWEQNHTSGKHDMHSELCYILIVHLKWKRSTFAG